MIRHPLTTTQGIVLQRNRHMEHDLRLKLFSKLEGKLITTVKGGQRPTSKLRVLHEPFTWGDYQIYLPPHKVYARLIGGKLIASNQFLRQNYQIFHLASQCCEIIDLLFPYRAPSADVFDILAYTLQNLQTSEFPRVEWILFQVRLLKALGHGDHFPEILKFLHPKERIQLDLWQKNSGSIAGKNLISDQSVGRCTSFLQRELQDLLPRKLKSDVLNII